MQFIVYDMEYTGARIAAEPLPVIPFSAAYYPEYQHIYNKCFSEMRRALDLRPYHCCTDLQQLLKKQAQIFLLMNGSTLLGSVSISGSDIDNLIVNPAYKGRGFGRRLLVWAVNRIRERTDAPIRLTVAEWNQRAVRLYTQTGFAVISKKQIG